MPMFNCHVEDFPNLQRAVLVFKEQSPT